MRIALLNQAHDDELAGALGQIAGAVANQLAIHVAPLWARLPPALFIVSSVDQLEPGDSAIVFVDEDADVPGALGYHDVDQIGIPFGRVLVKTLRDYGATIMTGANSISVTLSHEAGELMIDPFCDWWCDCEDGQTEEPLELCDRVEGDAYDLDGVSVSNFLTPMAFRMGGTTDRYDYMGKLATRGGMTSGGYQTLRTGGPSGSYSQVFGEQMPTWKQAIKRASLSSRHARRVP